MTAHSIKRKTKNQQNCISSVVSLAKTIPMFNVNLNNYKYPQNPILSAGAEGTWDCGGIIRATVIRVASNDWRMWYDGKDKNNRCAIGMATSTDGIHWKKYASNPVLEPKEPWEGKYISATSVIYLDGKFYLYYWGPGHNNPPPLKYIGLAVSEDGTQWERRGSIDGLTGAVLGPTPSILNECPKKNGTGVDAAKVFLLREENKMVMMFTAFGPNGFWNGIAESKDGILWTKTAAPIAPISGMLNRNTGMWSGGMTLRGVMKIGNLWVAFANAMGISGGIYPAAAFSMDSWVTFGNRILTANQDYESGSFNPVAIEVGDDWYHLYYSCGGNGNQGIGLVRAPRNSIHQPILIWDDEQMGTDGITSVTIEADDDPLQLSAISTENVDLFIKQKRPDNGTWVETYLTSLKANCISTLTMPRNYMIRIHAKPCASKISAWLFR